MPRNKKSGGADGSPGAPAWMVTFGDLMSLLLTFFVLLLSFSTTQEEDFKKAMESFRLALGVGVLQEQSGAPTSDTAGPMSSRTGRLKKTRQLARKRMQRTVRLRKMVTVSATKEGMRITLKDQLLFDSGRAIIKPEGVDVLKTLGRTLKPIEDEYYIQIEGHTDVDPLRAGHEFESNWELSGARSRSVLKAVIDGGLSSTSLSFVGFGEFRPINVDVDNTKLENKEKNRRVVLNVVSKRAYEKLLGRAAQVATQ
ncbi:flagellar motor protein MotB [Candidatus Hydrogenedentota bacterium]